MKNIRNRKELDESVVQDLINAPSLGNEKFIELVGKCLVNAIVDLLAQSKKCQ